MSVRHTVWVFGVTLLALASIGVRATLPDLIPNATGRWIFPALAIGLPVLALWPASLRELGATTVSVRGIALALAGSLAMPVAFVLSGLRPGLPTVNAVLFGVVLAALAEETLLRGFAFLQLVSRAGWPVWAAMLATATLFGLSHVPGALAAGEGGALVGTVLLTTMGGAWFAWLQWRWGGSLWVPVVMHGVMNAWWLLFSAGPTAGSGGSGAFWGRVVTITIVTVVSWPPRGIHPLAKGGVSA